MSARFPLGLGVALLLTLAGNAALAQYKWTDTEGHVGYGDQPPRDARQIERIDTNSLATPGGDALAALPYELRRAAQNFPAVLYAAPGSDCGPCNSARSFLRARGIPFSERTVGSSKDIAAYQALGAGAQLPALAVGRNLLRGFDPGAWSEALSRADYPHDSILPRGWQWPAPTPLAPPEPPPAPPTTEGN